MCANSFEQFHSECFPSRFKQTRIQFCKTPKEIESTWNRRHLSHTKRSSPTPPILVGQQQPFHVLQPQFRRHNERLRIHILQTQSNKTLPNSDGSETLKGQNKRGKLIRKEHNRQSFHFKRRAVQHPRHHNNPRQKKSQETEHAQTPSLFFPRVRTPCGRCAQVIIEGWETQHIDGGSKTQNQHQNSQQQPQNPNPKQNKNQGHNQRPPINVGSVSVRMWDRWEDELQNIKGPEFATKGKMHLIVGGCSGRPKQVDSTQCLHISLDAASWRFLAASLQTNR